MKLGHRILITNAALILGLVVLGGVSLYGVLALRRDMLIAYEEFQEMEIVAEIEGHVARLLAESDDNDTNVQVIKSELAAAIEQMGLLERLQEREGLASHEDPDHATHEIDSITRLGPQLREIHQTFANDSGEWGPVQHARLTRLSLAMLPELAEMMRVTHKAMRQAKTDSTDRIQLTALLLGITTTAIILAAMWISRTSYRGIVLPLLRLRHGVHRVANGRFDEPVTAGRIDEFNDLARDFNAMAEQLGDYRDQMETKVAIKGKELVRSERLASVGFLAAGVAHEINNPLGIISTYAEISLNELNERDDDPLIADVRRTLAIVHEEAHRCKAIIQKLLSLSRRGDDDRGPVSMSAVATRIVDTLGGLAQYRDRRIEVHVSDVDALLVHANQTEMNQVLLNLVVNALEAAPPADGVVRIMGERSAGHIVVRVIDNGRGMAPDTIDRVFEPFFTTREQTGGGVGLGLSICHAIVEAHGGRIMAESDGPGRGSCFIVEIPALQSEVAHDVA